MDHHTVQHIPPALTTRPVCRGPEERAVRDMLRRHLDDEDKREEEIQAPEDSSLRCPWIIERLVHCHRQGRKYDEEENHILKLRRFAERDASRPDGVLFATAAECVLWQRQFLRLLPRVLNFLISLRLVLILHIAAVLFVVVHEQGEEEVQHD